MNVAYYFSVGTSSESEEEIVFQRKNRKINVLKSPEVSLNRENKRQEKQKARKSNIKAKILFAFILISVHIGYE